MRSLPVPLSSPLAAFQSPPPRTRIVAAKLSPSPHQSSIVRSFVYLLAPVGRPVLDSRCLALAQSACDIGQR